MLESMSDEIKIMAEPQMEPSMCKFVFDKPLVTEGSFRFNSKEEAQGSSIAEALFVLPFVKSVFISANAVVVTQQGDSEWRTIGKEIGGALRDALSSGKPAISEELKKRLPDEKTIREKVASVLEREINPAIAAHGGVIELLDVKKNDIFIKMGGGCQGCAMSMATLKQGVDTSLRKEIPELGAIYDTTDHAAGLNPYFQPAQ